VPLRTVFANPVTNGYYKALYSMLILYEMFLQSFIKNWNKRSRSNPLEIQITFIWYKLFNIWKYIPHTYPSNFSCLSSAKENDNFVSERRCSFSTNTLFFRNEDSSYKIDTICKNYGIWMMLINWKMDPKFPTNTVNDKSLEWLKFGESGSQTFWWIKVCKFTTKLIKQLMVS